MLFIYYTPHIMADTAAFFTPKKGHVSTLHSINQPEHCTTQ